MVTFDNASPREKKNKYTDVVMDHFMNPRNLGTMDNADAEGNVGNPVCGDMMTIYIKVDKNKQGEEYLEDVKFQTLGCGAAIATSSILTEIAKGKTVKKAWNISDQDVAEKLGGLPPEKMHCSNLAASGLKKAIRAYYSKKETPPSFLKKEDNKKN